MKYYYEINLDIVQDCIFCTHTLIDHDTRGCEWQGCECRLRKGESMSESMITVTSVDQDIVLCDFCNSENKFLSKQYYLHLNKCKHPICAVCFQFFEVKNR